jgi:hypothetical protein
MNAYLDVWAMQAALDWTGVSSPEERYAKIKYTQMLLNDKSTMVEALRMAMEFILGEEIKLDSCDKTSTYKFKKNVLQKIQKIFEKRYSTSRICAPLHIKLNERRKKRVAGDEELEYEGTILEVARFVLAN